MIDSLTFKRTHLAQAFCDSLEGKGIANSTSGLFLAGPRWVGKSTFLKEDLIPEAQKRGWYTIYIDLWSNRQADPAFLIIETLKACFDTYKGKLSQLKNRLQLQKVNILGTIEFDFSKPELTDKFTLPQLLQLIIKLIGKPLLLLIDEAQHALSSKNGLNTMFALKSARDQINSSYQSPDLMLVLTGSNRDKLAQLVLKKEQPFFGSEIMTFPLLGKDYTDFFTDKINRALASTNQFHQDVMWEAFQRVGHRPEILRQIIARIAISNDAKSFSELLKQDIFTWHSQIWDEFDAEFNSLPCLQQLILKLLIDQGRTFSPFSEESMQYYKKMIKQEKLTVSSVQTAIQTLRDRGLIWQSSRGVYALEDESFAEWFKHTQRWHSCS